MSIRQVIIGSALALTVTATGAAERDTTSANFMLPYCKLAAGEVPESGVDVKDLMWVGLCMGIVDGIAMALNTYESKSYCAKLPSGGTLDQKVKVVVRAIEARPDMMHRDFRSLATFALMDAWPCKK
jgi:hypothetical protein